MGVDYNFSNCDIHDFKDVTTPADIAAGRAVFEFTPPPVLDRITIEWSRDWEYLSELLGDAADRFVQNVKDIAEPGE